MHKRIWWLGGGTILVIGVAIGVIVVTQHHKQPPTAPPALITAQASVDFPLYYATNKGTFQLAQQSVSVADQVVVCSYQYDHGKTLAVSMQPIGNLDVNQFNPTSDFTTAIGHAYLVDLENRTTAAVVGSKSWTLINAPSKISVGELMQFINSLRTVN